MSGAYGTGPLDSLTGLARVTVGAWARTAWWGVGTSARAARAAIELLDPPRADHDDGDLSPEDRADRPAPAHGPASLRDRGAALLRQSADVEAEDGAHPAYARILEELHPDEARILRLLALEGPQPAVDVRSIQLLGLGSDVVAEGLNMIGAQAGCRHPLRVHAYLDNLNRLGLIWFSKQAIEDPAVYQVLEAQPQVLGAVRGSSRTKTVHRSVRLTPFGRDFCEVCLPLEQEPVRQDPTEPATELAAESADPGGEAADPAGEAPGPAGTA
jgi:abortive infection alpha-like protein